MNLDLTVKVTDIVMIFAVLLGPIFAVCITIWAQQRNDKRSAKLQLFITLMSERKSVNVSNARANALNNIDVIFSDNEKVTSIWHKYYSLLSQSNHEERGHTWNELLSSMAKDLGISNLSLTDIDKFYTPQAHVDNYEFQQSVNNELLRVLKNTEHFVVEKRNDIDR